MYQTNQAFLEAMDDISRTLAVEVEIGGELYPTESIIDFELERGAFDGDVFTIGQTLSSALTLTIFTTSSIKLGDEVKLFTDLWVGDSYVRVPMGVYYVDATSINQEKMTLTCYDKMVSLVEEYIPNGQHKTLSALFNDVRSQIGMTYDGAFTDVAIKAPLYGYTYRETLGFIASLNGGNMIINRSGNLEIKGYQAVERHIPAKTCFSFDVKEPYRVSKVFCQFGDVGVTRGDSSGQCVAFENPYVTEQNIDVIYQRLNGLYFTAGSLKYRGDLTLDPGDLFTFTDYKGDDYVLMCGRNKLTFNGGLSGQLDSIGESETTNSYAESQLKYKKNLTKVTAELGKIQAVVQEIEQSHDGLEERVKKAELEMTADAITSKIKDTFVSKDEAGNLVTQEQLTSAIQQTSNDITLQVSSNYETKQNVTTKVNSAISTAASDAQTKANTALSSAKSYADTKKTEAINTASTDATNKANNAKNEAINSANNTLTTTIANYYTKEQTDSKISVAKDEINLGVSNKYETKANVETKVSSTLNSAKSYADTKKTEAINSAASDATSKVNAAKSELNTAIGKKANTVDVYSKAEVYTKGQTDSAIKVAKDEINLGVSNTYETKANVETKITSIQVGATNKLVGTATSKNTNVNVPTSYITWDPYTTHNKQTLEQLGFKVGDKVTVGFDWAISKNGSNDYVYGNFRVEFKGIKADGTDNQYLGVIKNPAATFSSSNTKGRVEATVTLDSNTVRAHTLRFRIDNSVLNFKVSNVKLEKGTKATSWSPAPEDISTDITTAKNDAISSASTDATNKANNAKTEAINSAKNTLNSTIANYYTKSQTDSQINVAKDAINLGVSQTYETKANVETKVSSTLNSAKSYADTKKTEAINSAASDATSKANKAKTDAINSANNTLTTTIKNYYTKTETDSQINVAKNAITSSVSSTYATKTDVTSSINGVNSSISNLQNRMNNAEQKITDTAITNVVKQNFYTKSETDKQITSKGYQTSSQVQQTVDNLQIKFSQSGGYNLIRNSTGYNGTNLWTGTATLGTSTNSTIGGACDKYMYLDNGTTTSERYAYSSRFKLKPSTTYTLTGWFHNYTKCPNFDVFVLSSTSVDSSDTGSSYTHVHHLIQAQNTNGAWKKYTASFTTPSGCKSGIVRIDNNGYNANGSNSNRINWSALILTEGALEVPWSPHPDEVYDGLTFIDKEGITVTASNVRSKTKMSADGFQLIRTTDNKKMFYVNQDGSLEMSGNFTQYDTNGKISIKIANNSYGCYDWLWDGDFVGKLAAFESNRTNTSGANQRFIGIANIADYGNQLVLGVRSSPNSTNFSTYMEIDNTGIMHRDYVTFTANTGFKTNAIFRNPSNNNETGRIFGATNNHFFVACNYNNQLRLGYEKNGSYYPGMSIYRNDNTSAGCAIEYYADEVHHNNVVIDGFLSVKGQKNRLVATENFGDRLLNAYETAECYFGDINETIIGEDGEVKVALDEVFLETVNTTEAYQVFLTKYGKGDCYVSERHEKYFVIKGTPNLSVGFEVKAKQRGYEKERLKMAVDTLKSHQATSCSPCSEDEVGYTIDCETTINRG